MEPVIQGLSDDEHGGVTNQANNGFMDSVMQGPSDDALDGVKIQDSNGSNVDA